MISEGTYRGRVLEADVGLSRTGKRQLQILFELEVGAGRKRMPHWVYFNTPDNAERALEVMAACGWQRGDMTLSTMRRRIVEVEIRHEKSPGGAMIPRIAWVRQLRGLYEQGHMVSEAREELFTRLTAFAERKGIGEAAPPPSAEEVPPPEVDDQGVVTDNDIPF